METTVNEAQIKKSAILKGIVLGIISVVLSLISLYLSANATSIITATIVNLLVNYGLFLLAGILFIVQLRKAIGGYWSFSVALKHIYIMLAVAAVLGFAGTTLFNVVTPNLQMKAIENTQNLTIEMMEAANAPDEQIDESLALLDQQKEAISNLSFGQIIKGLAVSLVMYFVLALILAAIFKKEQPIFRRVSASEGGSGDIAHPWKDGEDTPQK